MAEPEDRPPIHGSGKVLIMDDEDDIREAARELLIFMGFQVETAEHGAQAIEKYEAAINDGDPFEVVVVDLTVPGGIGGEETVLRILKIDPTAKVIICSGHIDEPMMKDYRSYGFCGAINKPYSSAELAEALHRAIEPRGVRDT